MYDDLVSNPYRGLVTPTKPVCRLRHILQRARDDLSPRSHTNQAGVQASTRRRNRQSSPGGVVVTPTKPVCRLRYAQRDRGRAYHTNQAGVQA